MITRRNTMGEELVTNIAARGERRPSRRVV